MQLCAFIAASLDGFIARADGALDWLPQPDPSSAEDYGYQQFLASVDTVVLGRATFETVLGFGVWPYEGKRGVVLSHRPLSLPTSFHPKIDRLAGPPADIAATLQAQGTRSAYVDGGRTLQGFLAAGLLDRLIVTRIPILLGAGLPLFGPLPRDLPLAHVQTRAFSSGCVQSEYRLETGAAVGPSPTGTP